VSRSAITHWWWSRSVQHLAETACEHWLSVPVFSRNKHTHTHTHTGPCTPHTATHVHSHTHTHTHTQAHRCPPLFTPRGICMQTALSETIWSHGDLFLRARWEYRRGGMETSFCRELILARASGKFLLNDRELRKRKKRLENLFSVLLDSILWIHGGLFLFFLSFFSPVGAAHRRILGTEMERKGGRGGAKGTKGTRVMTFRLVWLAGCLSVCLTASLVSYLTANRCHLLWDSSGLSDCCNTHPHGYDSQNTLWLDEWVLFHNMKYNV